MDLSIFHSSLFIFYEEFHAETEKLPACVLAFPPIPSLAGMTPQREKLLLPGSKLFLCLRISLFPPKVHTQQECFL